MSISRVLLFVIYHFCLHLEQSYSWGNSRSLDYLMYSQKQIWLSCEDNVFVFLLWPKQLQKIVLLNILSKSSHHALSILSQFTLWSVWFVNSIAWTWTFCISVLTIWRVFHWPSHVSSIDPLVDLGQLFKNMKLWRQTIHKNACRCVRIGCTHQLLYIMTKVLKVQFLINKLSRSSLWLIFKDMYGVWFYWPPTVQ